MFFSYFGAGALARFGRGIRSLVLAALLAAVLLPGAAHAACTSPAGIAGDITYNGDYHVLQYCNNVKWVAMTTTVNLPTTNGLIAYWKLDDGAGTSAVDSSGNGNTGTLTNGATFMTGGYYDGGVNFDGSNDLVSAAQATTSNTFTISAWIYPTRYGNSDTGNGIFYQGTGLNLLGTVLWVGTGPTIGTNTLGMRYEGGAIGKANNNVISLNAWQQVAVVYSAGTATFYVNGVQQGTASGMGSGAPASNLSYLGYWYDYTNAARYFQGSMDDVRVYNRPLSAAEITTLYNWHVSPPSSGLIDWWKFDESSGTVATDSAGGNTGTILNGPTFTSAGKLAGAVTFDGSTQYVSVGNPASLQLSTATLSAWIKTSNAGTSYRAIVAKGNAWDMYLKDNIFMIYDPGAAADRSTGINLADNAWHHVAVAFNSGVASGTTLYIDGVLKLTTTLTVGNQTQSFNIASGGGIQDFAGTIDDVRIYNRILSADEVYGIYRTSSPVCSSPSGYEGTYIYNSDFHVLQFCDNANWRPLGPVPGAGGAGCSSPAGSERDLIYSDSTKGSGVMQYCDGTHWIQLGGPNIPTSGLAGYWKFDEGSGATTADSSGNSNTGTLVSSPTWTTSGRDANALTVSGGNYITAANSASLILAGSWTVASWIKLSSTPGSGNNFVLATKDNSAWTANYALYADNGSGTCGAGLGWAVAFDSGSGEKCNKYVTSISTGTWYHVAGVWDSSSNNLYVYLNGVLVATQNTGAATPLAGGGQNLFLCQYLTGTCDDTRVYNRALSGAEILNLYNGT